MLQGHLIAEILQYYEAIDDPILAQAHRSSEFLGSIVQKVGNLLLYILVIICRSVLLTFENWFCLLKFSRREIWHIVTTSVGLTNGIWNRAIASVLSLIYFDELGMLYHE